MIFFLHVKTFKGKRGKKINEITLTAGSAKNDIANTLKHEATIFPSQVSG
jgi:hypothetical protein